MAELNSLQSFIAAQSQNRMKTANANGPDGTHNETIVIESLGESMVDSFSSLSSTIVGSIQALGSFLGEKLESMTEKIILAPKEKDAEDRVSAAEKAEKSREEMGNTGMGKLLLSILRAVENVSDSLGSLREKGSLAQILGAGIIFGGLIAGAIVGKFSPLLMPIKLGLSAIHSILSKPLKVPSLVKAIGQIGPRIAKILHGVLRPISSLFKVTGISKILGPIGVVFDNLLDVGKIIFSKIRGFSKILTALFPTFMQFGAKTKGLFSILGKIFGTAFKIGTRILAPIGWAIDFGMGLWQAWKEYKAGGNIKDIIVSFLSGFVNSFTLGLLKVDKLKGWFNWVWNKAEEIFNTIIKFMDPVITFWKTTFNEVMAFFKGEQSFVEMVRDIFLASATAIGTMMETAGKMLIGAFKGLALYLIEAIPGAQNLVPDNVLDWAGYEREVPNWTSSESFEGSKAGSREDSENFYKQATKRVFSTYDPIQKSIVTDKIDAFASQVGVGEEFKDWVLNDNNRGAIPVMRTMAGLLDDNTERNDQILTNLHAQFLEQKSNKPLRPIEKPQPIKGDLFSDIRPGQLQFDSEMGTPISKIIETRQLNVETQRSMIQYMQHQMAAKIAGEQVGHVAINNATSNSVNNHVALANPSAHDTARQNNSIRPKNNL